MDTKTLFKKIGYLSVDHIAVATPNLNETLEMYLNIVGSSLLKGPAKNEKQKVYYAFVKLKEGFTLEILQPTDKSSPIQKKIQEGVATIHICYTVKNISLAIDTIVSQGGEIIVEPQKDESFNDRFMAFLFHPLIGVFELVGTPQICK